MSTTLTDRYPTRLLTPAPAMTREDPTAWGTADDGPLTSDRLDAFDRLGYHAEQSLLTRQEIEVLQEEAARLAVDPVLRKDERTIVEEKSQAVRSVFEVHRISSVFARLAADPRVVGPARQMLGSEVYIHQSRVNYKPGFGGGPFYWHSDFETWHAEDGMPVPRAVSVSIALTENYPYNGSLMIIPGSHRTFVPCVGRTPQDHHRNSLRTHSVAVGMPDQNSVGELARTAGGIEQFTGPPGSATFFDSNCMHGSNGNITPYPRSNIFIVFNSVDNVLGTPFAAPAPRPTYIAGRDFTPVR
ncbi:multidrug DMT transporter permease [Streptomyces cyaneogriseus subsp. noncyanogenus]|uniref:Ectoine hydroxylase n=1 Tax=Streptomyces cyaneogriseus subsp. noncyanogenus TaxID=477245 RepID=A0A0C5G9G3_9ACTN|nr:ectoine hydroxylase [Streptomyces cyaneogriseus]AJP00736.1 multidrug DMT transporter permease [Streptomyces cyaneogriseus subsp. noncyanogenus]